MKKIITIILAGLVLSSCGVYKKYRSQNEAPADLYGTGDSITKAASEASIAEIDVIKDMTDRLDSIKVELSNTTTELGAISEELGASAEEVAASCQTVTDACSDTQNSTAEMRNINEDMSAAIDFFKLGE